jgi:hypothetical protein
MLIYEKLLDMSEDWLKYAIQLNLLHKNKNDLVELKKQAVNCEKIRAYLCDITNFHSTLVSNHKNPELPIHKLLFLLDNGLDATIPEIKIAVDEIMKHRDKNGVYQSLVNIPKHFGGSGEDMFSWCLCDAPLLLLALLKAGIDYSSHIKAGVDYLISFHKENGFPCAVSSELGKFRGPGGKEDCCPYATLIMLKLLSCIPEYQDSDIAKDTAFTLMNLWKNSLEKHPYMFYMGTDFRKLKAPAVWYDIVSVTDALSRCKSIRNDSRFKEMLALIQIKQDDNGLFIPEAVYQKLKGWDFGQKKTPSPYLTYLCLQIFEQAGV